MLLLFLFIRIFTGTFNIVNMYKCSKSKIFFSLFTPNCLFTSNWVEVRDSRRMCKPVYIPQFTYLMAWWRHNCVTQHVTKLRLQRCYLQFDRTVTDRFLECVRSKRLSTTFAGSGSPSYVHIFQFLLGNSSRQSLGRKSLTFQRVSDPKFYLQNSAYLILQSNYEVTISWHDVTQLWRHKAIKSLTVEYLLFIHVAAGREIVKIAHETPEL